MKRRDFIKQSTLITSALAIQESAQAGNHIYGRPSSLPHEEGDHGARPRVGSLLISRSGLPPEYWAEACSRAELFISSALAKDDSAKDSTDDYLSVLTADNHPLHEIDYNIATLVAVNSSLFKKLIREQNYALALDILLNDHGPPGRHHHALQRRLKEVLSRGASEIRELSGHSSRRQPISDKEVVRMMGMQHGVTEDHLALIHTLLECRLRPGEHANLLAVSVAAILVTAAAYVVVWVAVGAWVWVSGVEVIQGDNSTNRHPAQRLAQLDPTLVRKHERALTVARLTGVRGLAEASFDRLIRTETYALIGALRECAILDPDEIETEGLVDVLVMYGKKVAGLQ